MKVVYEIKKNNEKLNENLIMYLYHPSKISKFLESNNNIDNYLN